jgi:hypothetical protein
VKSNEQRLGKAGSGQVSCDTLGRGPFGCVSSGLQTTLVIGTEASSTVRSGMNHGGACCVDVRHVLFSLVWSGLIKEHLSHGRHGASSMTRRGMHCVLEGRVRAWQGTACCGRFGCGMVRRVMETTYTVGVVAASMPQGGMQFGLLRLVSVCRVGLGRVSNHSRLGTEADRRGRSGINHGMVVLVRVSFARSRSVSAWCGC